MEGVKQVLLRASRLPHFQVKKKKQKKINNPE